MKIPLFLRTYNSPFKRPKLKWYFGKIAVGVPYFLPRKWVKYTKEEALEQAQKEFENPHIKGRDLDFYIKRYQNSSRPVPRKFGFNFVGLGWKTKYNEYRYEFSPVWSFVFLGYQIAVTFTVTEPDHYWECFLFYYFETDKTKSREERIKQCKGEYPCIWTTHYNGTKETVDYYNIVLKRKYLE